MEQMSRMDIRIPLAIKEMIDLAASLEGRTRTDFLIEAANEKARRIIAESRIINLSLQDQILLAESLQDETIKEPDSFLKIMAEQYKKSVRCR